MIPSFFVLKKRTQPICFSSSLLGFQRGCHHFFKEKDTAEIFFLFFGYLFFFARFSPRNQRKTINLGVPVPEKKHTAPCGTRTREPLQAARRSFFPWAEASLEAPVRHQPSSGFRLGPSPKSFSFGRAPQNPNSCFFLLPPQKEGPQKPKGGPKQMAIASVRSLISISRVTNQEVGSS